jgi:DNA-binding IclR family transcriptional regulator
MRAPADRSPKRRAGPPARRARPAELRYPVPALDKGLDVLELLARETQGLLLNEIAAALGRTSSELFRMVNGLARRGYIEQRDGERYTLTLKLFELAHRHKPIKSLTAAAAPLMDRLAHRSLQSCHLTVFHDGRVMIVAEVDSPERYAFGMKVGALVGLTDTASGYVLLAFQDEATRSAMLTAHQKAEGELDVDPSQLMTVIRKVVRQGYAEVQSRQTRGVTNIAFPILGLPGRARAVLNVPYIERIDKKVTPSIAAVKELLRETAGELSLLMGHVASDGA